MKLKDLNIKLMWRLICVA